MEPLTNSRTLLECACHWEKTTPDNIYFTQPMGGGDDNIKTWTWKEAMDEARRMAAYIKDLNLPARSNIALCSKNCAHWIMADLAIWMAGHVSVPIFPILTADIVQYILEHSEAKLLFVGKLDPVWDDMKKGVPDDLPKVSFPLAPANEDKKWDDIIAEKEPLREVSECAEDEMATIIYTSGSTGTPKGVMHNFGAMHRSARGICEYLNTNSKERGLSYLPLAHVIERCAVEGGSLYCGFPLYFAESLDTFIKDLQRARPTLFISVPRLWLKFQQGVFQKLPPQKLNRLLKIPILNSIIKKKVLKNLGLDQVRFAFSGSAPLPKEIIIWYRDLGLELLEGYGMTENFIYSHMTKPGEVRPGYVGPPYPDVQQIISDEGEVLVRSPGNMIGYYKMPDENQNVFTKDGFLKTGDLGEIDEKGRLKITGRAKEIFKTSKGEYVAPAPIENMLSNHPLVEACFVSGAGYHKPYAVVMLFEEAREAIERGDKSDVEKKLAKLLSTVNGSLPAFEQLAFLAVTKDVWLPENGFLTPTLKLKRALLESTYGAFANQWFEE